MDKIKRLIFRFTPFLDWCCLAHSTLNKRMKNKQHIFLSHMAIFRSFSLSICSSESRLFSLTSSSSLSLSLPRLLSRVSCLGRLLSDRPCLSLITKLTIYFITNLTFIVIGWKGLRHTTFKVIGKTRGIKTALVKVERAEFYCTISMA